jgi:hypothetical protein
MQSVDVHRDLVRQVLSWGEERKVYLRNKETVASPSDVEVGQLLPMCGMLIAIFFLLPMP